MNYLLVIILLISAAALALSAISLRQSRSLKKSRETLLTGKGDVDFEAQLINQNSKLTRLSRQNEYIEETLKGLQEDYKFTVQNIGLVRYNPFNDEGGNLSFSLAILDAHKNGVIITSMHGREQNRIYAKPVYQGKSDYTLTIEEQRALGESKKLQK